MKQSVFVLCFSFFLALTAFSLISCEGGQATDQTGPEYTSAYVCPMHCESSGSAEPGKCPVCGMEYVANENYEQEGHDHVEGDDHAGGDAQVEGDDHAEGDDQGEGDGHDHQH